MAMFHILKICASCDIYLRGIGNVLGIIQVIWSQRVQVQGQCNVFLDLPVMKNFEKSMNIYPCLVGWKGMI